MIVSGLLVVALAAITALHVLWGLGGTWPERDEAALARLVVGDPKWTGMPPRPLTLAVAAALAAMTVLAGLLAVRLGGRLDGLVTLVAVPVGLVFLARGLVTYTAWWRRVHAREPFATRDRFFYGPLSAALGVGFLHLVATRI